MTTKAQCLKYQKGNRWHKRLRAWKICFFHVSSLAKGEQKAHKTTKNCLPQNRIQPKSLKKKKLEEGKLYCSAWDTACQISVRKYFPWVINSWKFKFIIENPSNP